MTGYLTLAEIAERWNCSKSWVRSLVVRKKLNAIPMGSVLVVKERDVEAYVHQSPGRPSQNGTRKSKAANRSRKSRNGRSPKA